jgi:uncharacterized protein YjbI with pentapeptide repeats
MDDRRTAEVLRRLVAGKSVTSLGLPEYEGRTDLRGLETHVRVAGGRPLLGAWGRAKKLHGLTEFKKVTLQGLDLSGAKAAGLRWHSCRVDDCVFDHAQLRDLRLWNTQVSGCSFARADLRDSVIGSWDAGRRNEWRQVSFAGADLRGATVRGALFDRCDFSRARLDGVEFEQCDLTECTFAGPLRGVIFDGRPLPDRPAPAPLRTVDFRAASFHGVEFWDCHPQDVVLPDDPGIYFIPQYREVARGALALLETDTSPEARMLRAELTESLRGPGDPTGAALFNRNDYTTDGSQPLALLAEHVLQQASSTP